MTRSDTLGQQSERHGGQPEEWLLAENARLEALAAERGDALEALTLLLRSNRMITASIDYEHVLAEVARIAGEALGSPECIVWEYEARSRQARFRCLWERDPVPGVAENLVGTSYDIRTHEGGVEGLCSALVMQQSRSDPGLSEQDIVDMDKWGEKTWLTVPLVAEDDLIGVMILIETEAERDFSQVERQLAASIGEQAATALANARRHQREETRNRWLEALVGATQALTSTLDIEALLPIVARLATEALGCKLGCIYEYDRARDVFVTRARYGADGLGRDEATGDEFPVSDTPDDRMALADGLVFVETISDPAIHPHVRAHMEAAGEKTLLNVPFRFQGEALGMLVLIETEAERLFTEDELAFMLAFGEQVAIAFNNARLYATIEALATVDGLTGLANHRTFYDRLEQEMARARRYRTPMSLLMIDIDDFKVLNDTWGHRAGDAVLRSLARLLGGQLRQNVDVPARYGGEEFAVILPNTQLGRTSRGPSGGQHEALPAAGAAAAGDPPPPGHSEGAAALAERLRAVIAGTGFEVGDGGATRLTVSIGVAAYPDTAHEMDELVARADAALYAAKRTGKDLVQVYRQ